MTQPAQRPQRRDATANRKRILDTARALFDSEGAENISMNRIAQAAGIGAGTLYRHFDNKAELCLALLGHHLEEIALEMGSLARTAEHDPSGTLFTMLERYIAFKEDYIPLFRIMEQAGEQFAGITRSPFYETVRQPFVDYFSAISPDDNGALDAVFRADILMAALSSDFLRYERVDRHLSIEEIAAKVRDVFLARPSSADAPMPSLRIVP